MLLRGAPKTVTPVPSTPGTRHRRGGGSGAEPRRHGPRAWLRTLRSFDDWRQVLVLRVVVPLILAAVSFYYLTRWASANDMPWFLAWTLPAALDVTAYKAVTVARHAANKTAQRKASALAWICVVLSVAGNIGSHALEARGPDGAPLLEVSIWTIAATSMVYPLMLVAGHNVAGGMSARPLNATQIRDRASLAAFARALTQATARAESAETARAAAEQTAREIRAATRRRPTPTQPRAEAPAQVSGPSPAPSPAGDYPGEIAAAPVAPAPSPAAPSREQLELEQIAEAVDYLRDYPEAGRRTVHQHLMKTWPTLTDHAVKTRIFPSAKAAGARSAA